MVFMEIGKQKGERRINIRRKRNDGVRVVKNTGTKEMRKR
jgi:hypothetical protein